MDPQAKRTLAATAMCLLALFAYLQIQEYRYRDAMPTTAPAVTRSSDPAPSRSSDTSTTQPRETPQDTPESGSQRFSIAPSTDGPDSIVLGGNGGAFKTKVVIGRRGVESIHLLEHRTGIKNKAPYRLIHSVENTPSFHTKMIRIANEKFDLDTGKVDWTLRENEVNNGESASATLLIKRGTKDYLRVTKVYHVEEGSHHLVIRYKLENLQGTKQKILITEGGPIGMVQADARFDDRRASAAHLDESDQLTDGDAFDRKTVHSEGNKKEFVPGDEHTLWAATANKYFACIVVPQPTGEEKYPTYLDRVSATCFDRESSHNDLSLEMVFAPDEIAPGNLESFVVDVFCGPKSRKLFEENVQAKTLGYEISTHADGTMCTFDWLSVLMYNLLDVIHGLVRNYGVAIIILVIFVRLLLHPISKKGQVQMMLMQKKMQGIKPKMDEVQQKYKNDRQKLNEEMMRVYREEGVNPAGTFLGCLPMVLQMPIWVALYTTLNTNVDMRHMPFFGYIQDLSSPDALIVFSGSYSIPLLSAVMGPITSLNILPILMSAIMYGQTKLTQKLTKPDKPPAPKLDAEGRPLPDTMAQQQKIMSVMMLFMGFFFYNMPSGLCLYILSSSLLAMAEQYYIRKHVKEREARGDLVTKRDPNKKPSRLEQMIKKAHDLAEQQRLEQSKKKKKK